MTDERGDSPIARRRAFHRTRSHPGVDSTRRVAWSRLSNPSAWHGRTAELACGPPSWSHRGQADVARRRPRPRPGASRRRAGSISTRCRSRKPKGPTTRPPPRGFARRTRGPCTPAATTPHKAIGLDVLDRLAARKFDGTVKLFFPPAEHLLGRRETDGRTRPRGRAALTGSSSEPACSRASVREPFWSGLPTTADARESPG